MKEVLFGTLAILSLSLTVWRWFIAARFPLHRHDPIPEELPGLTVLKPVKGAGREIQRCLRSWFQLKYPGPVQLLFGVASEEDPAHAVVRDLLAEFPQVDAQLIICGRRMGANGKVSKLRQLEPHIRHPLIMISDADVEVSPEFAARVTPLLADSSVGLVNCFYRLANPETTAMQWEAVGVNADFWSQVLQARSLGPVRFALGAVMTLPKALLERVGGFVALADYLADDYEMGQLIAQAGARIEFATEVVDCRETPGGWQEAWRHQLRWARTIRVCQPLPYFLSVLGNATLWPLLWLAVTSNPLALPFFGAALGFRILSAAHQQWKLTRRTGHLACFWLTPVKDILDAGIWAAAFWGNYVDWRGERYRVLTGGKLLRVERALEPEPSRT